MTVWSFWSGRTRLSPVLPAVCGAGSSSVFGALLDRPRPEIKGELLLFIIASNCGPDRFLGWFLVVFSHLWDLWDIWTTSKPSSVSLLFLSIQCLSENQMCRLVYPKDTSLGTWWNQAKWRGTSDCNNPLHKFVSLLSLRMLYIQWTKTFLQRRYCGEIVYMKPARRINPITWFRAWQHILHNNHYFSG